MGYRSPLICGRVLLFKDEDFGVIRLVDNGQMKHQSGFFAVKNSDFIKESAGKHLKLRGSQRLDLTRMMGLMRFLH